MYKIFEWITEAYGWFRIMLSPLLIASVIGYAIYLFNSNYRAFSFISIGIGLVTGIAWATRIWKSRGGTIQFLSKISHTDDIPASEQAI